jgi:two-component system, sensor histidine kinase YcbA
MRRARSSLAEKLLKPLGKRVFLIVVVTVMASELFVAGDIGPFRFSVGTIIFVYAALSLNQLLILPAALLIGLTTIILRLAVDHFLFLSAESTSFYFSYYYSGAFGFLLLALFLIPGKIRGRERQFTVPFFIYLVLAVTISNFGEALIRVGPEAVFTGNGLILLPLISAVQVFLVTSLFSLSQFQKTMVLDEQQRLSDENMLLVAAELYDELFYMQKSMENIENIMAKSYNLHKKLKEMKLIDRSLEVAALKVAEEVHEVKKDTVRILAGIGEVIEIRKDRPVMKLAEVFDLVLKTNRSYALSLGKKVQINLNLEPDLVVSQIYPLLAILNNLVSNAVEAIETEGYIDLRVRKRGQILRISVCDSGEPIRVGNRKLIFEPGFTTKFNADGVPSTGIGLAYVKGLVESFRGRVFLVPGDGDKCFVVLIPVRSVAGG